MSHSGDGADKLLLGAPQRHLIGHLIQIAQRLGALAVHAADGQSHLSDDLTHVAHLLAQGKHGQVQQQACPHSRPGIGGTGGQIAQLFVEGEGHVPGKLILGVEAFFRCTGQIKAVAHGLNAEVILFIHHDGEVLLFPQKHGGGSGVGQQVFTDLMAFRKALLLDAESNPAGE